MSAVKENNIARRAFALNFKNYQGGVYGFEEWFEKLKELEAVFGPEPWPGPGDYGHPA
ncbi:MAG: hypothetical protein QF451_05485 [Nitrospinota bacterium]|jgi:hypothetical protein|nr:hypothetical protein [Nitrospinota bacterium]MDP7503382.1 hypothetical protein [Nitrospinota bacterium]MDP7662709.1 hypothetical protein [Nitrospinota bacterium]